MEDLDFLKIHQRQAELIGFWSEEYKASIINSIESQYKTEILKEWTITDFVVNENKVLVKWNKRHFELSDDQIKEKYGRA